MKFAMRFILISILNLFVIRIFVRLTDQIHHSRRRWIDFVFLLFSLWGEYKLTRHFWMPLVSVAVCLLGMWIPKYLFRPRASGRGESDFLDHILLTMRSGVSLNQILISLSKVDFQWANWVRMSQIHQFPEGAPEISRVLRLCQERPTQAFGILSQYREMGRRREKLHRKYKAAGLQAKSQVVLSGFLYFGLLMFQFLYSPQFSEFLKAASGRICLLLSFALLFAGGFWVFRLGEPKEIVL